MLNSCFVWVLLEDVGPITCLWQSVLTFDQHWEHLPHFFLSDFSIFWYFWYYYFRLFVLSVYFNGKIWQMIPEIFFLFGIDLQHVPLFFNYRLYIQKSLIVHNNNENFSVGSFKKIPLSFSSAFSTSFLTLLHWSDMVNPEKYNHLYLSL